MYEHFFEQLPSAALIVDRDGLLLAANQACRRDFSRQGGAPPLPGMQVSQVFVGNQAQICGDLLTMASGGRAKITLRPRPRAQGDRPQDEAPATGATSTGATSTGNNAAADPQAGTPLVPPAARPGTMTFRVTALRPDQARAMQFVLVSDPSRPIQHGFQELNQQMRRANEEAARQRRLYASLQETYRDLEQFSYVAAHDLKAPLRNISVLMGFLKEDFADQLPAEALEMVEDSRTAAGRLQGLIDDLLNHARLGSAAMHKVPTALEPVLQGIERDLATSLDATGGRIRRGGPLGSIKADPRLLRQLLENLVGNAIKYRATDRPPEVRLGLERAGDGTARLRIDDNGIGFDPAEAEDIFAPFRRLLTAPEVEGSGIGLATCRNIAARHGWSLEAEGRPGEGASFIISGLETTTERD